MLAHFRPATMPLCLTVACLGLGTFPALSADHSFATDLDPNDITQSIHVADNPDRFQDEWLRPTVSVSDSFSDDSPLSITFLFSTPEWLRIYDLDDSSNDNGAGFTSEALNYILSFGSPLNSGDEITLAWELLDPNGDALFSGDFVTTLAFDNVATLAGVRAIGGGNIVPENGMTDFYGMRATLTARDEGGASLNVSLADFALGIRADDVLVLPEPSSLICLGLAGVPILWRRR